jgi:exopolyphosphatase/guanosine-5'-triphosphate,3'-diphosphate pyrophosphatase
MDILKKRIAAIDVGSNSVRLMIAEIGESGAIEPVKKELVMTRIYEGLARTGKLSTVAVDRTLAAINILKDKARQAGASSLFCFATAAVREAKNREEFLARAFRETGMTIDVLSEDEEACVGFIGTQEQGPRGAIDIGGGSTELAVGVWHDVHCSVSLKLGAVRALEKYPLGDLADALALEAMRQWAVSVLQSEGAGAKEAAEKLPGIRWTGIGGTITTVAAMDLKLAKYDSARVQGHELQRKCVEKTLARLAQTPLDRRRQIPGLQPERADIIIGGVVILLEFMNFMGVEQLFVSDRDNLEGYLVYKFSREANP